MTKEKKKGPKISVTTNLGLFYLTIEQSDAEPELVGPFKTLSEAEDERTRRAGLRNKR
ncbi:MAG: hypothetical protein ACRECY_04565 [Phyllobacterium sp.]